jgi:hypothetical protein
VTLAWPWVEESKGGKEESVGTVAGFFEAEAWEGV